MTHYIDICEIDNRPLIEPGCAVKAAIAAGALDPARWERYRKLRTERVTMKENDWKSRLGVV